MLIDAGPSSPRPAHIFKPLVRRASARSQRAFRSGATGSPERAARYDLTTVDPPRRAERNGPEKRAELAPAWWTCSAPRRSHHWSKHGTCLSTLNPTCYGHSHKQYDEVVDYFHRAVPLYKSLPTYDWLAASGIVPSNTETYTLSQLQTVAKQHHGYEIYWGCSGSELSEAWWHFVAKGPIKGGKIIPAEMVGESSCPEYAALLIDRHGISRRCLQLRTLVATLEAAPRAEMRPKLSLTSSSTVPKPAASSAKAPGTPPEPAPPVEPAVSEIASGVEFTMTSSKGPCASSDASEPSCAEGNAESTFSLDDELYLSYDNSTAFFDPQIATGSTQVAVSTEE
ncbi:hypothetical protein JCM11641_005257 [Rhodosporidiobolus odoratus]